MYSQISDLFKNYATSQTIIITNSHNPVYPPFPHTHLSFPLSP